MIKKSTGGEGLGAAMRAVGRGDSLPDSHWSQIFPLRQLPRVLRTRGKVNRVFLQISATLSLALVSL